MYRALNQLTRSIKPTSRIQILVTNEKTSRNISMQN